MEPFSLSGNIKIHMLSLKLGYDLPEENPAGQPVKLFLLHPTF